MSAKTVDLPGLARRISELLRLTPETTVELQLLRDGSVRAVKLPEG